MLRGQFAATYDRAYALNLRSFMVSGVSDDAALTNALAAMTAQGKSLFIPGGIGSSLVSGKPALKITTPNKVWDIDAGDVICGSNAIFDISGLQTPTGWVAPTGPNWAVSPNFFIKAQSIAALDDWLRVGRTKQWVGGTVWDGFQKPGLAGFLLGSNLTDQVASAVRVRIKDVTIGFTDIFLASGSNAFINTYENCTILSCKTRAYAFSPSVGANNATNSGENIRIIGGTIADGTGVGIESVFSDVYIDGLSYDYNNECPFGVTWNQSFLTFKNCHIEWSNMPTQPLFKNGGDDSSKNVIVVQDSCFAFNGPSNGVPTQDAYLAQSNTSNSFIKFANNTYYNLSSGDQYTPGGGLSWCDGKSFSTDFQPPNWGFGFGGRNQCNASAVFSASATPTYQNQEGYYKVVDGFCFFEFVCQWSGGPATGTMKFTMDGGMPANLSGSDLAVALRSVTLAAGTGDSFQARILAGTQNVVLSSMPAAGGAGTDLVAKASGTVAISGFYPC